MRHLVLALLALALLAPAATAAELTGTVFVHDLVENGAYVGCHVADEKYATFWLTVREGDRVTLDVQSPSNNTRSHTLVVQGHATTVERLNPGDAKSVTFTAGAPKSYALVCDDYVGGQGLLRVQQAPAEPATNETPAPAALAALAGLAFAAVALARRG